jgi:O-antigen/teichoic acid export membrane protein
VNLYLGLISFPILVGGAYIGGVNGAVWALAINLAGNWLLNHLALRKEACQYDVPFTFRNCSHELYVLWQFSLPVALAGAVVGPVNWVCNTLLVNRPGGYSEMGLFSAANQWRMAILFVPSMVGRVVLPMLSNLNGSEARTSYRKILRISIILNGGTGLAMALPIALLASGIMRSYGKGFEEGRWVLLCLVFSAVLMAVNNVVGQAIVSKGRVWLGFLLNLCWASALLVISWSLIQRGYGAFGLALATLIAYALHTVWQSVYLGHTLRESPLWNAARPGSTS